jgi:membrane-bound serine protease (ClpP class)
LDALIEKIAETPHARVITLQPTGFERLARWLTILSPILMTAGMILGYLEFQKPGFGVAGGLAALCFLLVFFGHYVAGLSGWEPLLIFLFGATLIIAEFLLFPGLILPALTGAVLLLAALLLMQIDRYPSDNLLPQPAQLEQPLQNLSLSLFTALLAGLLLARYLPKKPFYAKLEAATIPGPSLHFSATVQLGAEGLTLTPLRPAGSARIGDEPIDVISDGRLIEPGTRIRIVSIEGARIVVQPLECS